MARVASLLVLVFLLLVFRGSTSAATAVDDVALARSLVQEARAQLGEKCDNFAEFGALQARTGDSEASKRSFADAWNAVARLEDGPERRMLLIGIVELQTQVGQATEAIEASLRLTARCDQGITLGAIAVVQAEAGNAQDALRTVDRMPLEAFSGEPYLTLQLIAMSLSERRDFAGAIGVLNRIPSDDERAAKILARDAAAGQPSRKEQAMINQAAIRSTGFVALAENQANAGDRQAALQTALSIGLTAHRNAALRRVACIAADSADLVVAQMALDGIREPAQRDLALVRVVAEMAKVGRFMEASELVETIVGPGAKAAALFEIAKVHANRGDANAPRMLFEKGKLLNPDDADAHYAAARQIVAAYAQAGFLDLAKSFAREIKDPGALSESCQAIAAASWRKKASDAGQLFDQSQQAAEEISDPYKRCVRLRELAKIQFETGNRSAAKTAIELAAVAARKIEIGGGTDVIALTETATAQRDIGDSEGAAASFEIARTAARRYSDESYIARLLQDVAFAQARAGDVEGTLLVARWQESALHRSNMLLGVAKAILSRRDKTP